MAGTRPMEIISTVHELAYSAKRVCRQSPLEPNKLNGIQSQLIRFVTNSAQGGDRTRTVVSDRRILSPEVTT
jgi:hypothetical protein